MKPPTFPYFMLRKQKRQARSFDFSVFIKTCKLFYFILFPSLEASLDLSSGYISMILVIFFLRDECSGLLFDLGEAG